MLHHQGHLAKPHGQAQYGGALQQIAQITHTPVKAPLCLIYTEFIEAYAAR